MALTTDDISQISDLFNQGFKQLILPQLEKLEDGQESMKDWLEKLESKLDEHVLENEKKHEDAYADIGHYANTTPSISQFKKLERRVLTLEKHHKA
jgi:DNA repair photolyase